MTDEQRKIDKLRILLNAVESLDDKEPDFLGELKEAAWDILHEEPGCEFGDWQSILVERYPTEVVDTLGCDPEYVYSALADWWECMDYEDAETGECHTFKEWAEYFATERSVELYDMLAEAKGEIRRLEAHLHRKRLNPQPDT